MKLATMKNGTRDGVLAVVSQDLTRAVYASTAASTMQWALEHWDQVKPGLDELYRGLNAGTQQDAFPFDPDLLAAPLPRAYQWLDGSAFLSHGRRMEKAFNLAHSNEYEKFPLMYQGGSDDFLGPRDAIVLPSEDDGIDFEGEIAVIVGDVPMGVSSDEAADYINLIMLVNDVSLRALAPREMKTGFGFIHAKPSSAFSPVAVSPDELGAGWQHGRVCLPLRVKWNGQIFGEPDASQMSFSFPELIAHAAKTRRLRAGTIIGSGTVSNADTGVGTACISECRAEQMIQGQTSLTPFMSFGDRVRIEMLDREGNSIFGAIDQCIVKAPCFSGHSDDQLTLP
ncbi:MAG TPA: fumarylacetoacetate hydrolase family protein [Eoetvoesiella sp.]